MYCPLLIVQAAQAQEADDDDVSDIGFENESDGNSLDGESNNSPTDFGKGKRSAVNGDGQQKKRARRQ